MAGVHLPWICLGPRYDHFLPEDVALLHHYRDWKDSRTRDAVIDRTLLKYERSILARVGNAHSRIEKKRLRFPH